jgi:TolB-like protein/DNA-binding SARP family transcriptional activator
MDTASFLGNGGPARWSLRLFGDFQLGECPNGKKVALPRKRERVLLSYLVLISNFRQARRKLLTLLWGEGTDETSLDNLRVCVFNLRKALGDAERQVILSDDRDIVLDASAFEIDVLSFRRLVAGSGPAELEAAAKLYSGDFLEGLSIESDEFESWRREEATRCKGQALDGLTRLMTQLAALGENQRAIEAGLRILRLEPLHEGAARSLMRLYAGSGRRGTATQLYLTLAVALRKEHGAQPEAETRAVFAEISRGGEEQIQATPATDAKPHPSTDIARLSDALREPSPPPAPQPTPVQSAPRHIAPLGWIAAGGLAAAIALFPLFLFLQFAPAGDTTTAQQTAVDAAKGTSSLPAGTIALAVLPFANLSGDPSQEFFSDGMTEEITAALARVKGLTVLARTSAFEFKGQNRDIRAIGEALDARYLIEGSVRREGDRVRITAQLVQADNGANLWSESYDRQVTSVFSAQEEIAQATAGALMVPLGLQQGESLVPSRARDAAAYEDYLRARVLVRSRTLSKAPALLEQVVARDPDFAPAWALLGYTHSLVPAYSAGAPEFRAIVESSRPKAEAAANRAIQLDPKSADGYVALANVQSVHGKWREAEDLFSRAFALDPDYPDTLQSNGVMLANLGYLKRALAITQRLQLLEPFVPIFTVVHRRVLWLNGQTDAALALFKGAGPSLAKGRDFDLAIIYGSQGRFDEAADVLPNPESEFARLLRAAPVHVPSPQKLPPNGLSGFAELYLGAPDRALDIYESRVNIGYTGALMNWLWSGPFQSLRKTNRFKTLVRSAGMVDYWRERGWPDLCRPVGANDFACD